MLTWMCVLHVIARVLLWKSLKEFVVCTNTTYIKRYERQLLEKYLSCEKEARNAHDDRNDVAVKVTGTTDIIGHLPWKVSRVCSLFLK